MSMHAIRWENASCSAFAAVLLALGASAAEGPAVAARLVRFATWSAEGASSPNRLESFAHSARDTPLATNGCEAVFIVKAADKTRSVTGFDEDAFKLVSAQTDDGRDLLSDDPAEKVDWDVEVLHPPDNFVWLFITWAIWAMQTVVIPRVQGRSPGQVTQPQSL